MFMDHMFIEVYDGLKVIGSAYDPEFSLIEVIKIKRSEAESCWLSVLTLINSPFLLILLVLSVNRDRILGDAAQTREPEDF